jgi:hypothetical protein
VLGIATTPVSFALGRLFLLPYLLVMAPLRALATVAAWRGLHP